MVEGRCFGWLDNARFRRPWEAMSTTFTTTDPAMPRDLKVGDAASFYIKNAAEPTKISQIANQ